MQIMRIIEKDEQLPVPAMQKNSRLETPPAQEPDAKRERRTGKQRPRNRHLAANFIMAFIIMLAIIAISLGYLVIFIAGPLIKAVDSVPPDFPKDLAIYELDQARIRIQSPENKQIVARLASGLPEWALEPFRGYLTADIKTQIAAVLKDPNLLPRNMTIGELEKILSTSSDSKISVNLEWSGIAKTKDELFDYYERKLAGNGYQIRQKISDYEIDLSFFKPGIEGAMSIADSFAKDGNSVVRMTVNYLSKD